MEILLSIYYYKMIERVEDVRRLTYHGQI